ncbi:MAG: alpha-amylase family glycosyl hydrolase, partial [Acidobacteriaceae bacterium]
MSREQFDAAMPQEFWREVVDRVAREVPDTLLLAEAFWMMEGFFVRTLGMHRVYNSAFMNMLRDEENAKYRSYLKKTIEFDPDILKRYVNFMSNPDERTAIDQFGTGDKYFGVATMLATLPGLPMFGHGQIEGFTERYGMEFKQARMDESPNQDLVARHQRDVAPLLKRRKLFAESANFVLYDFWTGYGTVNENVFAYSNRLGDERALVLYNNSYGSTHGTIHLSAAAVDKGSGELRQTRIGDGLALSGYETIYAYRDTVTGLEYLRRTTDFHHRGLTVGLRGYQHMVLLDWRELHPSADYPWDRLCDALHGEGVHSVDAALSMLRLRPLHAALAEALSPAHIGAFAEIAGEIASPSTESALPAPPRDPELRVAQLQEFLNQCDLFFERAVISLPAENHDLASRLSETDEPAPRYRESCLHSAVASIHLSVLEKEFAADWPAVARLIPRTHQQWAQIAAWIVIGSLPWSYERGSAYDSLQLRQALAEIFTANGSEGEDIWRAAALVRVLLLQTEARDPQAFWKDGDVRWLAGVNHSDSVTYVNKEQFEQLVDWLHIPALLELAEEDPRPLEAILEIEAEIEDARESMAEAGYDLNAWLESREKEPEQIIDPESTPHVAAPPTLE